MRAASLMVRDWDAEKVTVLGVITWGTVFFPSCRILAITFSLSASSYNDIMLWLAMAVSSAADICGIL